jgi:glutathione synthase
VSVRLAFVVADVRDQKPDWTTVYLARAAMRAGHDVGFVDVDELTMTPDNQVVGQVVRPAAHGAPIESTEELSTALAHESRVVTSEVLTAWDVVFLRYNPNHDYPGMAPGNPAADFGWRLRLSGVLVVNDPEGMQRAGGRMYLSALPPEIRARTLITREPAKVKAFLAALDAPAVLKPLADKDNSDREHVFFVARRQVKNLNQIITVVRKTGYIVVQEYLPEAEQGEKRLLLLGGEPIRVGGRAAIYRRLGEERVACELGPTEERIVDMLRPKLLADGLYLVGVDIVGAKVLEVNVFTPGGVHPNLELYGIDASEAVIRDLERRVEVRRAYRKSA